MPRRLILATLLAAGGSVAAEDRASAGAATPEALRSLSGDPAYGAYLASECVACHRTDGEDAGIPSIVGWPEARFKAALHEYRIGARANAAMRLAASALSDADIEALAAWFAKAE